MSGKNFSKILVILTLSFLLFPNLASASGNSFSDVEKGSSHYEAIMELTKSEIIYGYEDGTFKPNKELKREHAAVLLFNAIGMLPPTNTKEVLDKFYQDVAENDKYADQIAALTPKIFKGSNGKFLPAATMTREQMATTIVKAFELEDNGKATSINLSNVDPSHQENVKILAQYGITNQLDDFRPKEGITRGQFATFIYKVLEKQLDVIDYTYYHSDFDKVLNSQAGNSPKLDGAGHFTASKQLVAYYANSHNFDMGTPEYLQFLSLTDSANLDAAEINEKVLKGKGKLEGTAETFIEAGKKYGINEVYLISHALHETGNGTSPLSKGIKVNGKTTYNMFGIGAIDKCPDKCGSERAYEEGWFTPEKAIMGGAAFIGNNYIKKGQDTLYKMRWNPDNPTHHQYATDVAWAVKQTGRIKSIYDLLDNYVLVFDVPIYNNQPGSSSKPEGEAQYAIDKSNAGMELLTTTDNLNMRTYPKVVSGNVITQLDDKTKVTVVGENGPWYKVEANGKIGWVTGAYLVPPYQLKVVNVNTSLYVRSEPTNKSKHVGYVHNGDMLTAVVDKNENYIIENDYYKITFNGKDAWVHSTYIEEQ